jgi:hypothetical protein
MFLIGQSPGVFKNAPDKIKTRVRPHAAYDADQGTAFIFHNKTLLFR